MPGVHSHEPTRDIGIGKDLMAASSAPIVRAILAEGDSDGGYLPVYAGRAAVAAIVFPRLVGWI